jgi:N6-L-threonylcarbamoyladenine synthase
MLALGYPGGPIIDQLAVHGDPKAIRFGTPKMSGNAHDFSFSGIKTAVLYHLQRHRELDPEIEKRRESLARGERSAAALRPLCSHATLDLIASFQHAVVEDLVTRTLAAAADTGAKSILVTGGVAANRELRTRFEEEAKRAGKEAFFPSRALSTDNAAMIAAAGYPSYAAGMYADSTLNADPNLPLTARMYESGR